MPSKVPRLSEYGINEKTGFLGHTPLTRLTDKYFDPWERVLDDLSHTLLAWKLRDVVHSIPALSVDGLVEEREQERAFLVLSLISHAYVWGAKGQPVLQILPSCLSRPWIHVSFKLGLRPISCHAALVYYNWKKLDAGGSMELSNLATLHTISGGIDESWFYLITMAIESVGAPLLSAIVRALECVSSESCDEVKLANELSAIADCVSLMSATLMRMPENCDPYIFYHRVRIYFSGWSNNVDIPNGLQYEGDCGQIEQMFLDEGEPRGCGVENASQVNEQHKRAPKRYPGGSAAQSALIHTLDIFLGVKHLPTGQKSGDDEPSPPRLNFLKDMVYHLPRKFRRWLRDLEQAAPAVRKHLLESSSKEAIVQYNRCIDNMKIFRDKHIQIVTRYIIIQARRAAETGQLDMSGEGYLGMGPDADKVIKLPAVSNSSSPRVDLLEQNDGLADSGMNALSLETKTPIVTIERGTERGTGGTEVMPFLKQSRNETQEARIQ